MGVDVRRAHSRLSVHLRRGATPELRRIVDDAAQILSGRARPMRPMDPYAVLGVGPGASHLRMKAAYRAQARLVHPDMGGTDELFRVVGQAYELVAGPDRQRVGTAGGGPTAARWRPESDPWRGIRVDRPPKPPPPKPYVAPPPEKRLQASRPRAALDLGLYLSVAAVGLGALAGLLAAGQVWLFLLAVALVVRGWRMLSPLVDGLGRSAARLRPASARMAPGTGSPIRFLEETCLHAPVNRLPDDLLYAAYVAWCRRRDRGAVSPWIFVEQLRSLGLLYVKATTWDGGMWVGLKLGPDAPR